MNANTSLAIAMVASLAISACSSTPKTTPAQTPPQEVSASDISSSTTAALPATDAASNNLAAQLQEMQKRSVYFGLDEFAVKPEYRGVIVQQAELMRTHADIAVTLEGNADERGSSEYNLALGSKRANAVGKSLEMAGIPGSRIKAISMGEERPRLTCHEEQCWKENRRVDFTAKQD